MSTALLASFSTLLASLRAFLIAFTAFVASFAVFFRSTLRFYLLEIFVAHPFAVPSTSDLVDR